MLIEILCCILCLCLLKNLFQVSMLGWPGSFLMLNLGTRLGDVGSLLLASLDLPNHLKHACFQYRMGTLLLYQAKIKIGSGQVKRQKCSNTVHCIKRTPLSWVKHQNVPNNSSNECIGIKTSIQQCSIETSGSINNKISIDLKLICLQVPADENKLK